MARVINNTSNSNLVASTRIPACRQAVNLNQEIHPYTVVAIILSIVVGFQTSIKHFRFPVFPAKYLVTKKGAPNDGALT